MIFFKHASANSFVSPYDFISSSGHHEVKYLAAFFVSTERDKLVVPDVFILSHQNWQYLYDA